MFIPMTNRMQSMKTSVDDPNVIISLMDPRKLMKLTINVTVMKVIADDLRDLARNSENGKLTSHLSADAIGLYRAIKPLYAYQATRSHLNHSSLRHDKQFFNFGVLVFFNTW